ncbi:ribbon-helix-helix domain-containing protein [Novosphingobium huizhouense]|uniref:ribbon-helix-helix domain-containing protein n=1 Tax=Novosphingobium huizhouense TaxID=2866625 RepID=UPI001CD836A7|nr:ribbon-helix-helix domain-containing protein [Novosphingobium huizhouense]
MPADRTSPYHPPVKRSVEIAGHKTSISLEPLFWDMLRAAAAAEGVPINALVARIDVERIAVATPPGLASAVRLWVANRLLRPSEQPSAQYTDGEDLGNGAAQAQE